jgi:hypothetical protein
MKQRFLLFFGLPNLFVDILHNNQMPNPFLISILTLITTLATTPTIANTDLNTPNKTTTIVGSNLQANANNAVNTDNVVVGGLLAVASAGISGDAATQTT